jgi:hypothetical protein
MKPGASESRFRHILTLGREYLTHWAIAGAIIALTGFAPEHWIADLLSHFSIPESLRTVDIRSGLVAVGVAIFAWDVLHRSRLQKQVEIHNNPVGAYDFVKIANRNSGDHQASDGSTPPLTDKPSIAVLPFQNMSGDPEQEYFADGMVEEIITGLSRIKWLLVISRNSSFIYKNKPVAV